MNTTSLATIQSDELETIQRTGRMLAASGYFDAKGEGAQAIAMMATKILAGREIGIGPFASVNGIHIISGKPSIGANLLASAVKSSGRYDYRVKELTNEVCRIEYFQRNGDKWESIGVSEFSKADAAKAQTKNMDKFPKNMLFARAMSNGVRFYTPDVFGGNAVYVPEELGAEVDGEGNVIDVTPRQVEPSTGEIADAAANLPTVDDIIFERDEWTPPTDEEHDIITVWQSSQDAYTWAVNTGACANGFEAENSMKKIARENNMRFTAENKQAIFLATLRHWNAKLQLQEAKERLGIAA